MVLISPSMPLRSRGAPIVLLEDEPNDAFFLKLALQTASIQNRLHTFDSVDGIRVFLKAVSRDQLPVLFIVDLNVPGHEDGIDFLRWLRQQGGRLQSTPVMILTGSLRFVDREMSRSFGSLGFLEKPVTATMFTDAVQALGFTVTNLPSDPVALRIERIADAVP